MEEYGKEHDVNYRQEVLQPLFRYIRGTNSFFVLGGASVGKTRLMDFIFGRDMQKHYLSDQTKKTWLIRVDLNRHYAKEDWHFYELFLSSMALSTLEHEKSFEILEELASLESQVLESKDFLRSLRFFELAAYKLCHFYGLNLCFLLDEFDEMYRTMPREFFAQLRAIRDANKNQLCYGLFLRDLPEQLRDIKENESFYELLSHRMIGLGPYLHDDAIRVIQQIEVREDHPLTPSLRETFYKASGGHPGLINALFNQRINVSAGKEQMDDPAWVTSDGILKEECNKIFGSLSNEEQQGLLSFVSGNPVPPKALKTLQAKGFIQKKNHSNKIFSVIFEKYLQEKVVPVNH
jgi:hypothetical protein